MKPHRSSKTGRMINNYDDLFEDIMRYKDSTGEKTFETDEDLRFFLLGDGVRGGVNENLLGKLEDTRAWKKRVTGVKTEDVENEKHEEEMRKESEGIMDISLYPEKHKFKKGDVVSKKGEVVKYDGRRFRNSRGQFA